MTKETLSDFDDAALIDFSIRLEVNGKSNQVGDLTLHPEQ